MKSLTFRNIYTQKQFIINDYESYKLTELCQILQRESNSPIYEASMTHILKGRRKFIGEWKIITEIKSDEKKFNKTNRKKKASVPQGFSQLTQAEKINNMRKAHREALRTGNRRLATTLAEMLRNYDAKSIKASQGDDLSRLTKLTRPITNPRTMSVKLKCEKYDTRIKNFI